MSWKRFFVICSIPVLLLTGLLSCDQSRTDDCLKQSDPDWPVVWTTFNTGAFRGDLDEEQVFKKLEADIKDVKSHGVDLIDANPRTIREARMMLDLARKHGVKLSIKVASDPHIGSFDAHDIKPAYAVMNGGVFKGKAIDRHLFQFTPDKHKIILEPPVYNSNFAYVDKKTGLPAVHYYPGVGSPLKAELIVPLAAYDGAQHLKVVPAEIIEAPANSVPDNDSATPDMHQNPEIKKRVLYQLSFDLTGLDDAMLDKVGLAVFWNCKGYDGTWNLMSRIQVAVADDATKEFARKDVQKGLSFWSEANGGTFPQDVVFAGRYGDENFYLTAHLRSPANHAVSIPLWDFSPSFIREFSLHCKEETYPRTWGFPEVYGTDSYTWWLYLLHKHSGELVDVVKDELSKSEVELVVYRNITRNGVFSLVNDFDGTGPEILVQKFDVIHLDPYVVLASGYGNSIVRDMSYYSGLSRRYDKPLVPWIQACTDVGTLKNKGGMRHPTPEQMLRMIEEHRAQGFDGIKWFGYGAGRYTYPDGNPETWAKAAEVHRELHRQLPEKPKAQLAVVRPYAERSLVMYSEGKVKNPADYLLKQFLDVWAIQYSKVYDVFEVPPGLTETELDALKEEIRAYPFVVSTTHWEGAKVVGENTLSTLYSVDNDEETRAKFAGQIKEWGWLE